MGVVFMLVLSANARAALTIEITKGVDTALPIAVVPFAVGGDPLLPVDVAEVVAADLKRSGRFAPLPRQDMLSRPSETAQVNFRDWRLVNVESLVIGRVNRTGAGYTVQFQLFDVFRGVQLAGYSVRSDADGLRRAAHQIADIIYETLTGEPGAFNTRIAYVTVAQLADGSRRYALEVSDADGYDPKAVVHSKQPLMSPSWSADGNRLAYVTFENKRSQIYLQNLLTGQRELLTSFAGINGAPAWSPNGRELALTLSKDGNPEIYVMDIASKQLRRVTESLGIDTEPAWSPDGRTIYFTSDRGGSTQIYRVAATGGRPERVTFEGGYNARATVSADGKSLAMINRDSSGDHIAVLNLQSGALKVLTDGRFDESPSFAPNGRMIIYATRTANRRGVLAAVSVDGGVQQRFSAREGDAREPVWSPMRQ